MKEYFDYIEAALLFEPMSGGTNVPGFQLEPRHQYAMRREPVQIPARPQRIRTIRVNIGGVTRVR
jgi:hypothetical protein